MEKQQEQALDEEERPLTIEEVHIELAILGYDNVTEEANAQNGPDNLSKYAFAHPHGVTSPIATVMMTCLTFSSNKK